MPRKRLLGLLIPLACAALFVRLGVWQLDRGRQRAAINAGLEARLAEAPVAFHEVAADTGDTQWRRVRLTGRWRFDLEQVQAPRTNAGSPGVHLLTPFERVERPETLVVVTRGWVYSADASSVDLARWREREGEVIEIAGYVQPLAEEGPPPPAGGAPLRTVHRSALAARIGAPVSPHMVIMTSDSVPRADSVPRRLAMPIVDPGPHRSYAIQWFAFATIAVIGGIALARRPTSG